MKYAIKGYSRISTEHQLPPQPLLNSAVEHSNAEVAAAAAVGCLKASQVGAPS